MIGQPEKHQSFLNACESRSNKDAIMHRLRLTLQPFFMSPFIGHLNSVFL